MELVNAVTEVFTAMSTWLVSAIEATLPVFYNAEDGLTIIGLLCVISVSIGIFFLIFGLIQRFMGFGA